MSRLSEETIGRYFVHTDGSVWRHVGYCAYPTATMQRVDAADRALPGGEPERRGGAVGSLILDGFTLLVPEEKT